MVALAVASLAAFGAEPLTSVTDRLFVCPLSDTVAPITGSPFWSVTLPFTVAYAISVEAVPIFCIFAPV